MWEVEVGEAGGGESGTEKNPPSLHHRMTPGLFEHHRLIILDTEKVDFFCNLLNSLFFFSMELLPAFTDGKTVSSDGEFCRRIITWCGGGGISLDLITSWLYQLSTAPLFKHSH